jgi:hypothetical protein
MVIFGLGQLFLQVWGKFLEVKPQSMLLTILFTGSSLFLSSQHVNAIDEQPKLGDYRPMYQFLSSADFIASRPDKEGRTFCKSLIGLSKNEVVERFVGRTETSPLGWIYFDDRTLFSCGDVNMTSQIQLEYKFDRVVRVREVRSSGLFLPEAKNGRLVGKWVK